MEGLGLSTLSSIDTADLEFQTFFMRIKDDQLLTTRLHSYDGSALEPAYQPPKSLGRTSKASGEQKQEIYEGNCHCGAVTLTVETTPLSETGVCSCDCTICVKVGPP